MFRVFALSVVACAQGLTHLSCGRAKMPAELGAWSSGLRHMDSAVVDNKAVNINEGQIYVYENFFPGYEIKYLNIENLAMRSCGASATVKAGGVGHSSVLVVLQAEANNEIRSVIDVWGSPGGPRASPPPPPPPPGLRSRYLRAPYRPVSHNTQPRHL